MAGWYSLCSFGIVFPFWYVWTNKNLATLVCMTCRQQQKSTQTDFLKKKQRLTCQSFALIYLRPQMHWTQPKPFIVSASVSVSSMYLYLFYLSLSQQLEANVAANQKFYGPVPKTLQNK
jgi:hypothetical protein